MSHAVEKDLTKEKTKPSDMIPDAVRQDDQWHSGAYAELKIDLTDEQEILDYHEEYQLTQQALRIDIDPRYQLALDVIMKANTEKSREVKSMNIPAFYEIFADDLQKEREEGRKEGRVEGREEGRREGHEEGRKEAARETTAKAIGNLMDSLKMSADAAMDILKVSEAERSFYQSML